MLWFYLPLFPILTVGFSTISILFDPDLKTTNSVGFPKSKYTESEQNALKQFRVIVNDTLDNDYERTDVFLIPWLRAHKLNLASANKMLRAAKKWRRDYRMDSILNETLVKPKGTRNPCVIDGLDKEGNPIVFLHLGGIDIRKWVLLGKSDELTRYITKCQEKTVVRIRELAKTTGKDITQSNSIADFEGYNLKQHACIGCFRMYLDFIINTENYYPQLSKYLVVINAPASAKPLFEIAKGIMSENTGKGLKIFGTDKKEFSKYLLEIIDADQLPIRYGGTRKEVVVDED